jgi:hypothetical protein
LPVHGKVSKIIAVALAVAGLVAAVAAGPAAAGSAPGQFGLVPAPAPGGAARGYFTMTIAPGGTARDSIVFRNYGATTEVLRADVASGTTAADSGSAFGGLSGACAGTACWVTGIPGEITLRPYASRTVPFQVAVPGRTQPGQYLAGITAQPATRPRPVRLKGNGHSTPQIVFIGRVTIGVAVTVGKLAELDTRLAVTGVTASWMVTAVRLAVGVDNHGHRFTKANGAVSCTLGATTRRYAVHMDTVLPGQGAALPVTGTGMGAGAWLCTVRLKDSGGAIDTWSGDVTVPGTVPPAPERVASGEYAYTANTSMPSWAMALFVLGALILSLSVILLRRGRMRRGGRSGS